MSRWSSTGRLLTVHNLAVVTLCLLATSSGTGVGSRECSADKSMSSANCESVQHDERESSILENRRQEGINDIISQKELFYSSNEVRQRVRDMIAKNDSYWRLEYCEEQKDGFELRILDESIDERVANTVHTALSVLITNSEYFKFNSGDPELDRANINLVAGPQVDQLKCHQDLTAMNELASDLKFRLQQMRNHSRTALNLREEHFRLARVLDSYGRYEPGLLSGKTHLVGQQDQCVSTNLLLAKSASDGQTRLEQVGSRFCWANLNIDKHLHHDLKYRTKDSFDLEHDQLFMSLCLPKSCHAKTFEGNEKLIQSLVDNQLRLPNLLYLDEHLKVDSIFCSPDPESYYGRIPFSGKLLLAFLLGWFVLMVYATKVHRPVAKATNQTAALFMDCLNLRQSFMDFVGHRDYSRAELEKLESKRETQKVDLSVLNPVKALGSAFVVMGHSLVVYLLLGQNVLRTYYMIKFDPILVLMIVGTFVVDSFFVISGLLIAYLVMKMADKPRSNTEPEAEESKTVKGPRKEGKVKLFFKYWFMFTLNRHLQLVPLLYLVFWFKKSITINYFTDRPLWDNSLNKETMFGGCRQESWLSPLTMMAATQPLSKQCLSQTWSISADLFFSLIIPPVLLLMPIRPKLAFLLGGAMSLISVAWTAISYSRIDPVYKTALDGASPYGLRLQFGSITHIYAYPHYRVCSVMVGLLTGYYLTVYEKKTSSNPKWTWPNRVLLATKIGASLLVMMMAGFICATLWREQLHIVVSYAFANLYTTLRVIWASTNAILFLRMASDWRNSYFMRFFKNRFWNSLAKLSYCSLLIHLEVLSCMSIVPGSFGLFEKLAIMRNFGASYFYSIILSCLLFVVYENPFSKLTKRLIVPKMNKLLFS